MGLREHQIDFINRLSWGTPSVTLCLSTQTQEIFRFPPPPHFGFGHDKVISQIIGPTYDISGNRLTLDSQIQISTTFQNLYLTVSHIPLVIPETTIRVDIGHPPLAHNAFHPLDQCSNLIR